MVEPLRVLMVCPQFRPLIGGYEQAAERLGLELSRRGLEVTVVTERRDPSWPAREMLDRMPIRRLYSSNRRRMQTLSGILSLSLYLFFEGWRFDVIHVHQYGWPSSLAILFGMLARRPVVLKLTSTGPQGIRATLGRLPGRTLHLGLHRHLSACIATSRRASEEMVGIGLDASRVHLIPNGLDTEAFAPPSVESRAQARLKLQLDDSPLVLTVCQMRPEKCLPLLLDAWVRVRRRIPEARLAIVGDGNEMSKLREQAERLNLDSSLLLPGRSSDPRPWYQAADLYVLSSVNEGLSNSLMEALSSGLPVVSTRVSGSEDIVEAADTGLLVPVNDEAAMGEAIFELLDDPERAKACGIRASEYATSHFRLESVAEKVAKLYSDLQAGRFGR